MSPTMNWGLLYVSYINFHKDNEQNFFKTLRTINFLKVQWGLFLCRLLVRASCYVIFISLIIICSCLRHSIVTGLQCCCHFLSLHPPPTEVLGGGGEQLGILCSADFLSLGTSHKEWQSQDTLKWKVLLLWWILTALFLEHPLDIGYGCQSCAGSAC